MRYRNLFLSGVLAVALIVAGVWGYNQNKLKSDYEISLNNSYKRLFYDLKDHVENVQVNLSKALVSDSKEQNILLLSNIMQQAYSAEEKLGQLPVSHSDTAKTQKFLNQVADYSYALISDSLEGKPINNENKESLLNLQNYTETLSKELQDLYQKLNDGSISLKAVKRKQREDLEDANEDMLNEKLVQLEEQMTQTPELIYDGPFSDQVLNVKPKGLKDKDVSLEEAEDLAVKFIGREKVKSIERFEEGEQMDKTAKIPAYTFAITPEDGEDSPNITIGISKKEGKAVYMRNPRSVGKMTVSVKEGLKKALEFLKERGYDNLEPNYSLKYDNMAIYNFNYKQGDVTIYTDTVKVEVALDDGEIVGFDAAAYLIAHHERDIPSPILTEEEARQRVKTNFDVDSVRLAIIPKKGLEEVLCYEFKGTYQDSPFIVYIDALTGQETKILKIIKDENGTLTF